ncbi:hypothetical protein B0H13DRAFT_1881679 [Mycena leptocephala]|nr:hypothetical protein B0H13DRAFT_1881679 [Mycena leptocephala]
MKLQFLLVFMSLLPHVLPANLPPLTGLFGTLQDSLQDLIDDALAATYAPIAPRPERNPKGTYAASAAGPVMTVTARLGQSATWQVRVRRVYDRGRVLRTAADSGGLPFFPLVVYLNGVIHRHATATPIARRTGQFAPMLACTGRSAQAVLTAPRGRIVQRVQAEEPADIVERRSLTNSLRPVSKNYDMRALTKPIWRKSFRKIRAWKPLGRALQEHQLSAEWAAELGQRWIRRIRISQQRKKSEKGGSKTQVIRHTTTTRTAATSCAHRRSPAATESTHHSRSRPACTRFILPFRAILARFPASCLLLPSISPPPPRN